MKRLQSRRAYTAAALSLLLLLAMDVQAAGKKRVRADRMEAMPSHEVVEHGSFVLRVLSYNVHGVPLMSKDPARYTEIGRILGEQRRAGTAPHVVSVQEAFPERAADLIRFSGYPYYVWGSGSEGKVTNAGLLILSEFPIVAKASAPFSFCASWDCYARKGVLHARIRLPGIRPALEVFNTHMNSNLEFDSWTDRQAPVQARFNQLQEIQEFMWAVSEPGAPTIFAGDFNFRPREDEFISFEAFTSMNDAARVCLDKNAGCTGQDPLEDWTKTVDHQFMRSGRNPGVKLTPVHYERNFREPVGGRKLSDHPGLEIHYKVEW